MINDSTKGEEQQKGLLDSLEQTLGWVFLVTHAWSCSLYVFTRRGFGRDFFGLATLAAVPILLVMATMSRSNAELTLFKSLSIAWIISVSIHRIRLISGLSDLDTHSRYNGWPMLCDFLPVEEQVAKLLWEPSLIISLGLLAHCVSMKAFGAYLVIGGAACLIDGLIIKQRMVRRSVQINDADIEQRVVLSDFEGRFGKR